MSRFGGREPFGKDHDRARELAAARLAEAVAPSEVAWLDGHLAWCAPCRAVAAEYESQRLALRSFRLEAPAPPRDLWARTAAAIEAETPARPVRPGAPARSTVRGRQPFPVAPLASLLVVAVAVGASLLNGVPQIVPQASGSPAAASPTFPGATPIAVTARDVPLVRQAADGTLVLQVGRIREVCPLDVESCDGQASIERRELGRITAGSASHVLLSPTRSHLVVLDRSEGDGGVYVVAMADLPGPTPTPSASVAPDVTSDPTARPTPAPGDTPRPSAPAASPSPSLPAPSSPSPSPSVPPASEPPTSTPDASPPVEPSPTASVEVSPGPGEAVRIIDGVELVGSVAGYATDGSAFAFTARPADGSTGPDVYLWRTGESEARPITDDHDVVFADWLGSLLLVSRAETAGDGAPGVPVTTLLDPVSGEETAIEGVAMWRPAVDPLVRAAVWWDGTVTRSADGFSWVPADGRLVIGTWPGAKAPDPEPTEPPATPPAEPTTPAPVVLAQGPVSEWQVRWDETGTRLAVWIGGLANPALGRLSLYQIDPATGTLVSGEPLLKDAIADAGFALGSGRLAWSAPTAEGETVVEVLAWSEETVGRVRLSPEATLVVVR